MVIFGRPEGLGSSEFDEFVDFDAPDRGRDRKVVMSGRPEGFGSSELDEIVDFYAPDRGRDRRMVSFCIPPN